MIYADYTYYYEIYGGNAINEQDFARLARVASAFIDTITYGNAAAAAGDTAEKVKDACCAVCEVIRQEENGGEVASASNDGYSESYVTSGKSIDKKKYDAAAVFLSPTGLLYSGVERC